MLKISGVGKSFDGLQALKDIDLDVREGRIHGIIGPNGSGKTTLFNCITGLLNPNTGNIVFCSEEITHQKPHLIAKMGIRRTFQGGKLVPGMTVLTNVMSGVYDFTPKDAFNTFLRLPFKESKKDAEIKSKAYDILRLVNMEKAADKWADDLVWAERQFIQIARALISNPKLLLLDEPASGMGLKEKEKVEILIKKIRDRGITVVVVSHHVKMIMNLSNWVTVLNFGEKISEGFPDKIQSDPRVLEAYIGKE